MQKDLIEKAESIAAKHRVKTYLKSFLSEWYGAPFVVDRVAAEALSRPNGNTVLGQCLMNAAKKADQARDKADRIEVLYTYPKNYAEGLVEPLVAEGKDMNWLIEHLLMPECDFLYEERRGLSNVS